MTDRPNILVITTDQQSHHMLSCAGNRWLQTPAMDRIAAWGTRLGRGYCSNPVCVPSRFSLWTGRMPSSIGLRYTQAASEQAPEVHQGGLGHLMRSAGYTAAFGGKLHCPANLSVASLGFDDLTRDERDRLAVDAAAFIRQRHDRPWFLAANFINPHDICYQAIRAFAGDAPGEQRLLESGRLELAELDEALQLPPGIDLETFFAQHCPPLPANFAIADDEPAAIRWLVDQRAFRHLARSQWSERDWRLHRWAYHRLTERVDSQIAVVLDALEQSGQVEQTLIIFTSDHGDHSASHHLEHKTSFYDESTRVPLIVARPGHAPAGAVDTSWIANNGLDLMATCCDYAGIERPDWNRGHSLRPVIEGQDHAATAPSGAYGESQLGFMWVSRNHKFCHYDACGEEEVLYDLDADPGETRNCTQDPAKQQVVAEHRVALAAARAEHAALGLASVGSA